MKKKMFCLGILFLFACDLSLNAQQTMSVIPPIVHDYATATKDFPVVDVHRECATIRYDSHDYKGVIRAINDLHKDIERVTGAKTNVSADAVSGKYEIIIGTLGKSKVYRCSRRFRQDKASELAREMGKLCNSNC